MKHMKKIGAVFVAAGLALSVSGCSGKTEDSVKAIQEAGVLKVAIVNSDNYYTSMQGDQPTGMEPELISTIVSALGVTTEYQVLSEAEALSAVSAGTADIAIGCISAPSDSSGSYRTTTSYGKGFYYAVTNKGDFAQSTGAFANSVIGIDNGMSDTNRSKFYTAESITLNEYSKAENAAADIKSDRIRAYICMEEDAKVLLSDPELQLQNMFDMDPEEYVIVAESGDQTLVNGMNTLIAQFLVKE